MLTQRNETQGTLCKVDQIIRWAKLLRIIRGAKNKYPCFLSFNKQSPISVLKFHNVALF